MALWSLKGKKILIIDDFAEMRSNLRNMLTPFGAEDISMAKNGEETIELIEENEYDIILCDYNLGDGKDGQQVLEEVKLRGKLPYSTVFIMVTAESTSLMVMGALEHQPDDYLSKPFTRNVLQSRLEKILDRKSGLKKLSVALQEDNKNLAITLCDEGIEQNPSNRNELLKLKSELLIAQKQYDEAKKLCGTVLTERSLPWAQSCIGQIHYLQEEYNSAQQSFEEIIRETPAYVSAYDWLAKTQVKQNNSVAAQETIARAIEQSAKSVTRQRMQADISETNGDLETAEKARRRSIRTAKNSILSNAKDYTKLANILVKSDKPKDALKSIELAKHAFKDDEQAQIAVTLAKSKVCESMGQEDETLALIEQASELVKNSSTPIDDELAIELTESFLAHDKAEAAKDLVEQLVTNNHDNQELLDKVKKVYSGSKEDPTAIIAGAQKEITAINNKGVKLLQSGEIDEAITLFRQALAKAPNNQVLNMNCAQAYLMKIKAGDKNDELLRKTRECLEKTVDNPSLQERYKTLNDAYWKASSRK